MLLKKTNFQIFKKLKIGRRSLSGINNQGKKTLFHRGGAVKRAYRIIDFYRYISYIPALIVSVEYDPNRTAPLSIAAYANGAVTYILAIDNLTPGMIINTLPTLTSNKLTEGYTSPLSLLRPGSHLNSVEVIPKTKATYVRAGGNFAKLVSIAKDEYAVIKLKSKTLLRLKASNIATLGIIMLPFRLALNSAGTSRRLGKRPHVRGVAMNPVDHPHGGGQGKTSGGRPSVTPWAYTTKGGRTRKKIKYAKTILKR